MEMDAPLWMRRFATGGGAARKKRSMSSVLPRPTAPKM
jgi:hypothetical protein